ADIFALPVAAIPAPAAVLFVWVPASQLPAAFEVLKAWYFEYVTNIVWVKDKSGLGYWLRNQHEHLLVATRGDMPTPAASVRPRSVIQAPRRDTSRMPAQVYTL